VRHFHGPTSHEGAAGAHGHSHPAEHGAEEAGEKGANDAGMVTHQKEE